MEDGLTTETQRIERLKTWLDEFDGKISAFCKHYGLSRTRASYLSQLLSGVRPLGERAARKLEQECNRPSGWLDMGAQKPQALNYDVARFAQLSQTDKELIEGFIEFVLARHDRATAQSVKFPPMDLTENFSPPEQQMEAIRAVARKPKSRNTQGHAEESRRKRNAA